jgi:hypothetical protein
MFSDSLPDRLQCLKAIAYDGSMDANALAGMVINSSKDRRIAVL